MKCREIQPMMRTFIVRALSFSAVAALTLNPALTPVVASDYRTAAPVTTDGQMNARFLSLGIGKSIVIDLPREIKDVLVADPKVANAVVRSTQRAYIIGAAVGHQQAVKRAAYASQPAQEYTVQRCETRYRDEWQERTDGYRVTYVYNGRRQVTELANRPGDRIRVRVDVSPAE